MERPKVPEFQAVILENPVVAVLIVDDARDAVPLAEALVAGGVRSMELTLRTDAALEALAAIKKGVPEMTAGVGTVIFPEQVRPIVDAGADFAVAPGFSRGVVEAALTLGLPFAPGIATPSDVEAALPFGFRVLKFYPAEAMGGLPYLSAMTAPYRHLGLSFVPLGGVNPGNLKEYLGSPLIAAVGGSWIAKRELIRAKDWETIRRNASEATALAASAEEEE
ncbi:MAG: bifunctional 4-hydroxy-2-oxoglutarate aldolase/2-dehydro-3-deoxy-phosphogluconate aldolase [Spirochaetaceae bacterium]